MSMNNTDTLLSAVQGFEMEHGMKPSYILLSTDVFRAVAREVGAESMKYKGVVDMRGEDIKIAGIMVAQLPGTKRVELVLDPVEYKGRWIQ